MKIAYFSSSRLPSRSANSVQVMKMCEALTENGHQVELFARPGHNCPEIESIFAKYGVKTHFGINLVAAPDFWLAGGIIYGWKTVKSMQNTGFTPDLIYGRNVYALIFAANLGTDICYEAHSAPYHVGRLCLERLLFATPACKQLVVINKTLNDYYLEKHRGILNRKVRVIIAPDGASVSHQPSSRVENTISRPVLGYAGSMFPGKGLEKIIEIASVMPECSFRIAGGSPEEIAAIQRLSPGNIFFCGHLDHAVIPEFLQQCDILLAPYQHRVTTTPGGAGNIAPWMSPLKIFEYMASHRPIIASRLPAIEEILCDTRTALLVDPSDTTEWCRAIRLLASDPGLRQKLAQAAATEIRNRFSWKQRASLIIDHYRTTNAARKSTPAQNLMKPPECLHIIGNLSAGGAEKMLCRMLTAADQTVFRHRVITLLQPGELATELEKHGITVNSLGMNRNWPNPLRILALSRMIRRLAPDVVHTWMYHADLFGGLATAMAGNIPLIFSIRHGSFHNDPLKTKVSAHVSAALARFLPTRIIACSERAAAAHIDFGYPAGIIRVIPNGFEIPRYFAADAGCRLRQTLGISETAALIGIIGRYHPAKDHANFIAAATIVAARYPDTHFIMCGAGMNDDNAPLLKALKLAGIAPQTHLLGHRQDVSAIMAGLTLLVSSSITEAFPNVVGEAMSLGIPCVVTDVGESANLVARTGRVVQPANPTALAEGIIEMLDAGFSSLRATGNLARQRIEEFFSLNAVVKQYEKLYLEVADEQRRKQTAR